MLHRRQAMLRPYRADGFHKEDLTTECLIEQSGICVLWACKHRSKSRAPKSLMLFVFPSVVGILYLDLYVLSINMFTELLSVRSNFTETGNSLPRHMLPYLGVASFVLPA